MVKVEGQDLLEKLLPFQFKVSKELQAVTAVMAALDLTDPTQVFQLPCIHYIT